MLHSSSHGDSQIDWSLDTWYVWPWLQSHAYRRCPAVLLVLFLLSRTLVCFSLGTWQQPELCSCFLHEEDLGHSTLDLKYLLRVWAWSHTSNFRTPSSHNLDQLSVVSAIASDKGDRLESCDLLE